MKITKRQLRRIIKETMIQRQSGLSDIMAQMACHDIEDDAGYEDGQRDAGIPSKMDQIDPSPAR